MRERLKRAGAIFITVLLTMQLAPDVVWAADLTRGEVTISIPTDESYNVSEAGKLYVINNGSVSGRIVVYSGGELHVRDGGEVTGNIEVDYSGEAYVEENGNVSSINAYGRDPNVENSGTIDTLFIAEGILVNNGSINTVLARKFNGTYGNRTDALTVTLGSGSSIGEFDMSSVNGDMNHQVTISATSGATIENAIFDVNYLGESTGPIKVVSSLEILGSGGIPSGMSITVGSASTSISKEENVYQFFVTYDGIDYPIPTGSLSNASLNSLYGASVVTKDVALPDLEIGYGEADITEAQKEVAIDVTGTASMNYKITSIPDFIELVDAEGEPITIDSGEISLNGGSSNLITVRAKSGNALGDYSGDLKLEIRTDVVGNDGVGGLSDIVLKEATIPISLSVLRKKGSGSITVEDIYYGETLNPVVESSTNGEANVTIEYKVKGADESTYKAEAPVKAGEYTARATFAATDEYLEVVDTDDFSVRKKTGSGTITVEDSYCGGTLNPVVTSETNGKENVTIEYKAKDAADSTYTAEAPVKAGEYTARATFAATDGYLAVVATDDFTIAYWPAPKNPYKVSGTKGDNKYYTSAVTIVPAEGYLIADSLDGDYKEELVLNKSTEGFAIYLKKADTGWKTSAIDVPGVLIDKDAPQILNAASGDVIYADQAEVIVKDENLTKVLVNGKSVNVKDYQAVLELSSNMCEEEYEIIAKDIAGNQKKVQITVAAPWMKNKVMPSGVKVRLNRASEYTLGSGTWKVNGDETSYSGNVSFYVKKDGEYSFTKVD